MPGVTGGDIRAAFLTVCAEATPADQMEQFHVSLYRRESWFGGPEEGGWWGSDVVLVASQEFPTSDAADAAAARVRRLAVELSRDAKDAFNRQCAAECKWLEARGLDADFLPEVDGEATYSVSVESRPGECAHEGDRCYS